MVYGRVYMHTHVENTIRANIHNEYRITYLSIHENLNSVNSHRRPKQISCGSMNFIEIVREYVTIL